MREDTNETKLTDLRVTYDAYNATLSHMPFLLLELFPLPSGLSNDYLFFRSQLTFDLYLILGESGSLSFMVLASQAFITSHGYCGYVLTHLSMSLLTITSKGLRLQEVQLP